jgi:hypothetical protein
MPTLNKDSLPYNAKITEFLCDYCETPAFAHNKNAKFCSDLCRHNAYIDRKANKNLAKRENDVNITEKSHKNLVPNFFVKPKPVGTKIIGAHFVEYHFRKMGIKITLKRIRGIEIDRAIKINEFEIMRVNKKAWMVSKLS